MKRKSKSRLSGILWVVILIFLSIVITFPNWISIFYPEPHRDIVFNAAYDNHIDPYLVFAIIRVESKFQPTAESPVGARGLMQIMPETAQWIASQQGIEEFDAADLHEPEVNIQFGCWYIANLSQEFNDNLPLVIAAYNAGRGQVGEWLQSGEWDGSLEGVKDIPFVETKQYIENVMQNYEAYRAIYTRDK